MNDAASGAGPDPRDEPTAPLSAGERLRAAREARGLSLDDIAEQTRVPIRHLAAIEASDYSALPTPTYAIGFAKAYARAVDIDEVAVARDVRQRMSSTIGQRAEYQPYELHDPARLPSRGLTIGAAVVAFILLVGALIWFGSSLFESRDQPSEQVASAPVPATVAVPQPTAAPPRAAQVAINAIGRVWVRVYDSSGKTLFENTMNPGDHYVVPAEADRPLLSVGRPDQVQLTLNGATLPPLGTGAKPMKDVAIDPGSLRAREEAPGAQAVASGVSAPSQTSAPATTSTATRTTSAPSPSASPTARPKPKPTPKPSSAPLKLDLTTTPPPLPANTTGIY